MRLKIKRLQFKWVVAVFLVIIILMGVYWTCLWFENRSTLTETRGDLTEHYTQDGLLEYAGSFYKRKENLMTVLLIGVDQTKGSGTLGSYRNGGQADFLRLAIIDRENKRVFQIGIDRDTMTPITILGVLGNPSGERMAQVSLSHGFGDGKESSCALTVEAVSKLFLDTPIDFYVAMNLDGVRVLNDLVGGVTITLEEDFSWLDPAMTEGTTLTLTGEQAEIFIRTRYSSSSGTNEARMERQEQYLQQFVLEFEQRVQEDEQFIGKVYDELTEYLITDLSKGQMINEVAAAQDYELESVLWLEGEHRVGSDGFMQFYADQEALEQMVIDIFYEKVE